MSREVIEDFFEWWISAHPISATNLGIHAYDGELPDLSLEGIRKKIKKMREFFEKVEKPEENDELLLKLWLEREIFVLEKIRSWERDPNYVEILCSSLYPLHVRNFAPLGERMESLIARLRKTRRFLDGAKSAVRKPVRIYTQIAIESVPLAREWLNSIRGDEEVKDAVNFAKEEIRLFQEWLYKILPDAEEKFAIGKRKLKKLLELDNLGSIRELLSLAEVEISESRNEILKLATEIDPKKEWKRVGKEILSKHPSGWEEVSMEYRKILKFSRNFLLGKELAPLLREEVVVKKTPEFMRHLLPFAAYLSPGPFEKSKSESKTGILWVTPGKHSYASIRNTVVHECYPGHHLHLVWCGMNESKIRKIYRNPALIEGWAHYAEELMMEYGFEPSTENRLVYEIDRLWRACRVVLDIKLHTGEMDMEEGVRFLVENCGMSEESATCEVKRYTRTPGYQLGYFAGKRIIKRMKELAGVEDKEFHTFIFKAGMVPFPILERMIKGK